MKLTLEICIIKRDGKREDFSSTSGCGGSGWWCRFCYGRYSWTDRGSFWGSRLGHSFLRHIERTIVLVHVVDGASVEGRDPLEDILTINKELEAYNPELLKRPQVIAANKMDACFSEDDSNDIIARLKAEFEPKGIKVFPISAVSRQGVKELLWHVNDC